MLTAVHVHVCKCTCGYDQGALYNSTLYVPIEVKTQYDMISSLPCFTIDGSSFN